MMFPEFVLGFQVFFVRFLLFGHEKFRRQKAEKKVGTKTLNGTVTKHCHTTSGLLGEAVKTAQNDGAKKRKVALYGSVRKNPIRYLTSPVNHFLKICFVDC